MSLGGLLLGALLAQAADAGPAPLTWLAPGPTAQTTQPEVRLFFGVDGPGDFSLQRGTEPVPCTVQRRPGARPVGHCRVALEVGRNALTARLGAFELQGLALRVDTTGRLDPLAQEGFGAQPLHRPEIEATCAACHPALSPGAPPRDDTCASCHPVASRPKVHGPVAQGNCLVCHSTPAESRYGVKWPIQETCFGCHLDVKGTMWRKAFRHGPAAAGRCTTCHDPHGSDQPFWLKKPAFALCTSCHVEKASERHVVVGFVYGDSHPLQGRPHPLKPNTEFACPACHNPHAAPARFLWQFDVTRREALCRTCHDK